MYTTTNGLYQSELLAGMPQFFHCFSSRMHGDARKPETVRSILSALNADTVRAKGARQIHGANVARIDADSIDVIPDADGLVSATAGLALTVRVADCVPILLVDPVARVVGVAHAGWKGTRSNIASEAVKKMESSGATAKNIVALIGPHIGNCCYTVDEERVKIFSGLFPGDSHAVYHKHDSWYLDLGYINRYQLLASGIEPSHIDEAGVCTSCHVDTLFSYRKETKETFGELVGIIGLK